MIVVFFLLISAAVPASVPDGIPGRTPLDPGYRGARPTLAAGPDRTLAVTVGPRVHRYTRDGRLVAVTDAPQTRASEPLPPGATAVADGGGHYAELSADRLVVTGPHACTLPLRVGSGGDALVVSDTRTWSARAAQPPFALAVDAGFAALSEKGGMLLIDLARCAPVAALPDDAWGSPAAMGLLDGELVSVTGTRDLTVRRWRLPDLAPVGAFGTRVSALLPGRAGPVAVLPGFLDAAGAGTLLLGPTPTVATGVLQLLGTSLFTLDLQGRVRQLDGDGKVVAQSGPGALSALDRLDQGDGAWWLADNASVLHLPGGELVPRRREGPDDPDRHDALAEDGPFLDLDPALPSTRGDLWALRLRPEGLVVTRSGRQWGAVLPVHGLPTHGQLARVSPDGRVVVTVFDGQLSAFRVDNGARLWTAADEGEQLALGVDWVATLRAGVWSFRRTDTGALLAELLPTQAIEVGGDIHPFNPTLLKSTPWKAGTPTSQPYVPRPRPDAVWSLGLEACADLPRALAPLAVFPEVYASQRASLIARCRPVSQPTPPPRWPSLPTAVEGASWAWNAGEPVKRLTPLPGGAVLVATGTRYGALGPDGALRWVAPAIRDVLVSGDLVLHNGYNRITARDAATGAIRWELPGAVYDHDGQLVLRPGANSPFLTFDPATLTRTPIPVVSSGTAFGWSCRGADCQTSRSLTERPRPNQEVSATAEDTNGGSRTWVAVGGVVTARGLPGPARAASPKIEEEPAPTPRPGPPAEIPIVPGLIRAWEAGLEPAYRLVDGIDGAIFQRNGVPRWSAYGRARLGVLDGVAVVRDPVGAHEGRAILDGSVLWTRALGDARVTPGGLIGREGASWSAWDAQTGERIGSWSAAVRAVTRDAEGRPIAALDAGEMTVLKRGASDEGEELCLLPAYIVSLQTVGPMLVAFGNGGEVFGIDVSGVAETEDRVRWSVVERGIRAVHTATVAGAGLVVLERADWRVAVDAATGAVRDVVPVQR